MRRTQWQNLLHDQRHDVMLATPSVCTWRGFFYSELHPRDSELHPREPGLTRLSRHFIVRYPLALCVPALPTVGQYTPQSFAVLLRMSLCVHVCVCTCVCVRVVCGPRGILKYTTDSEYMPDGLLVMFAQQ